MEEFAEYFCPFCASTPFLSREDLQSHVQLKHHEIGSDTDDSDNAAEQPSEVLDFQPPEQPDPPSPEMSDSENGLEPRHAPKKNQRRSSQRRPVFKLRNARSGVWRTSKRTEPEFEVITPERAKYFDGLQDAVRVQNSILSRGICFKDGGDCDAFKRGKPDFDVLADRCASIDTAVAYLQEKGVLKEQPRYDTSTWKLGATLDTIANSLFFLNSYCLEVKGGRWVKF